MNSKIIIDYREHEVIKKLTASTKLKGYLDTQNLDIADIILEYQEYRFLIERKSISDLISSIKDGRYKEQKMRLLSAKHQHPFTSICYILEGDPKFRKPADENLYYGSWISTTLRDQIPVFRTSSMDETVSLIVRLFMRLQKDPEQFFPSLPEISLPEVSIPSIQTLLNIDQQTDLQSSTSSSEQDTEITQTGNYPISSDGNGNGNETNAPNESTYRTINIKPKKGSGNKKQTTIEHSFTEPLPQDINNEIQNTTQNTTQNVGNNEPKEDKINYQYLASIKQKKKENITPKVWDAMAISNIPGISIKMAEYILAEYKTIRNIYQHYQNLNEEKEREEMLSQIVLVSDKGTSRKLGLVASKKIYNFIYQH